jgi:hypothetical protein
VWDAVWEIASLPAFRVVPDSILNGSFEAMLLFNSAIWGVCAAVVVMRRT